MDYGKILYEYQNGNVKTTIYEDGTKINEWPDGEEPYFTHPSSVDCKITNWCDMDKVCVYCHEMSNKEGEHGDLELIKQVWQNQFPGTEMAIGGGNPLAHPGLTDFLRHMTAQGVIPNVTVNMLHMKKFQDTIKQYQDEKLIYGLGISYRGRQSMNLLPDTISYKDAVFHMIMGVHDLKDVRAVITWCKYKKITPKILLLGYKTFGKGKEYYSAELQEVLDLWKSKYIHELLEADGIVLSFDNLALRQLDFRSIIGEEEWNKFYMGDDGSSTLFVDAVEKTFARTSTSDIRYPLSADCRVDGIMTVIQNERLTNP